MAYQRSCCCRWVLFLLVCYNLLMHLGLCADERQPLPSMCYRDNITNSDFHYTILGDWYLESGEKMNAAACVTGCREMSHSSTTPLKHAGVQAGNMCLCGGDVDKARSENAADQCNVTCAGDSTDTCGSDTDDLVTSVWELNSVSMNSFTYSSDKNQYVNYVVQPTDEIANNYSFRYGDGSPDSRANLNSSLRHHYPFPGTYIVTVVETNKNLPDLNVSISQIVEVTDSIAVDKKWNCAKLLVMVNEAIVCNLILDGGTDIPLTFNLTNRDDNQVVDSFEMIADVIVTPIGIGVPQVDSVGVQTDAPSADSQTVVYVLNDAVVHDDGYIKGFQVYGAKAGAVKFGVLRWAGNSGSKFCHVGETCGSKRAYSLWEDLYSSEFTYKPQVVLEAAQIKVGYNDISLARNEWVPVTRGDVLYYQPSGGSAAYRSVAKNETADSSYNEPPTKLDGSNSVSSSQEIKHFIRAIHVSPLELEYRYTPTKPGLFIVSVGPTEVDQQVKIQVDSLLDFTIQPTFWNNITSKFRPGYGLDKNEILEYARVKLTPTVINGIV